MDKVTRSMISFDWAMKRLLRSKANFEVLEGFLSELLRREIVIKNIGESESNKESETDKFNIVDMLVEADGRELVIIELQYGRDTDYFQRMLYGVSKTLVEHVDQGNEFLEIRKVYSVNIVYFNLGEGDDYVYHGNTRFWGLHTHGELRLTTAQREKYEKNIPGDLYPEYYIIKVGKFDDVARNTLDEWIYYLKNNMICDNFTAKGLARARQLLAYDGLSDDEKRQYRYHIKNRHALNSQMRTAYSDGETKGLKKGLKKGEAIGLKKGEAERNRLKAEIEAAQAEKDAERRNVVVNSSKAGISVETISKITGLTVEEITDILENRS
jgi:predicted transposase/invertase (TIGR01784 family)